MTKVPAPSPSSQAGFTIRHATQADAAFLFSLAPRLSGVPRPPWHSLQDMEAFQQRFMEDTLGNLAEGAITLIAIATDNAPLGYIHAMPGTDGVTGEPCGYVAIIAVADAAEGKGIAAQLMTQAENWARRQGYRFLSLDAFAGNTHALDFYRRGGFQPETIRLVKPL